jgi:hypothetical protein
MRSTAPSPSLRGRSETAASSSPVSSGARVSHGGHLDTVPLGHEILAVAEQRAESQLLAEGPGDLALDDLGVARQARRFATVDALNPDYS